MIIIIWYSEEGYGRKHQESIRESYYDRDSKDLHAGIESSERCLVYEQNDWLEWLMLQVHGLRPADAQKEHQQRLW